MNTKIDIGNRIKETREGIGLKKSDIARALNVSHQSVQQWESGQTSPRGERMSRLAAFLGVPIEFLAFGKSEEPLESAYNTVDGKSAELLMKNVGKAFRKTLLEISDIGWVSVKESIDVDMLSDVMIRNLQKSFENSD